MKTNGASRNPLREARGRRQRGAPGSYLSVKDKWQRYREALLALRDELSRQRAELLQAERVDGTGTAVDEMDAAAAEQDRAVAAERLSSHQDVLQEIEAALKRIESGEYGICERTGRAIPARRLRALPWTRFCREAEAELEAGPP
jgi:RNA polymerase-binding protein DksA